MYKLARRSNLIPFILVLSVGIGSGILVPQSFPQTIGDIPMFALFPGEIAIALILSVLLFENASPGDLIRIAGFMVGVAMGTGAISNAVTQSTVMMPELTLKLNWVQMLAFNLTGLGAVITFYSSESDEIQAYGQYTKSPSKKEAVNPHPSPASSAATTGSTGSSSTETVTQNHTAENQRETLNNLYMDRLSQLEHTINNPGAQGKVSLESLFAEESQAAIGERSKADECIPLPEARAGDDWGTPSSGSEAKNEDRTQKPGEGGLADLDNLFADIGAPGVQEDFSPPLSNQSKGDILARPEGASSEDPDKESKLAEAGSVAAAAVKEFGKLSATVSAKPELKTPGTLRTIGQMLLDTQAVERIIKEAEHSEPGSKWQVLSLDKGANLQSLMNKLTSFDGVEDALLIGKDGMLLSNTESIAPLKYVVGPLSLAIHSTTNLGAGKLQLGTLRQTILRSGDKLSILTDVGPAILAVFGSWELSTIDGLLDFIAAQAAESAQAAELPTQKEKPQAIQPEKIPTPSPSQPEDQKQEKQKPPIKTDDTNTENSFLGVSDNEITSLFDDILAGDSLDKQTTSSLSPDTKTEQAVPAKEETPLKQDKKNSGIFNVDDNEVSDLFDNLLSEESSDKVINTEKASAIEEKSVSAEKETEKAAPSQEMKEFGKLSPNAAHNQETGQEQGSMKAIGRQLIDAQAVENIIKAGENRTKIGSGMTTARVISAARGEGIQTLLHKIDGYDGVIGSLIVGHDGLVIASTLKTGIDKEVMGAMCHAMHSHLDVATKKLAQGKLHQAIFLSPNAQLTVLTSVAVGILAVLSDETKPDQLDGLLSAIETTIHG